MRRLPWIVPVALAAVLPLAPAARAGEPAPSPSAAAPTAAPSPSATAPSAAPSPSATTPPAAPAGGGATGKKVIAQELFDQGMALMQEGKFAEACPKLEASNKAEWAPGTTINLADCYERIGRLASAWALFLECEPHFRNRNPPDSRADIARQRADSLYPKLSRIDISVPAGVEVAGLVIKRDGDPVDASQWGTGLPVDPGKHVVEASAPGKKTWRWEADVGAGGATVSVPVPALEDDPTAGPAPPAPGGEPGMPLQKKIALGAGAAGVAGLALGGVFGGLTLGAVGDADRSCTKVDGTFQCDRAGADLRRQATAFSTASTVGFIAGGVLVAGAVVLWFSAPSTAPAKPSKDMARIRKVWLAPAVGAQSAGLSAGGQF